MIFISNKLNLFEDLIIIYNMNPTFFCNKKSLQIISANIRNDIKKIISTIGTFNLTSKYYTFLNKKNVNNLKENKFLVSLSTFGKKFILFITKYNNKKYCIFINKKNDIMTVTQLKFDDDIFLGTLFDGELVKNSNNKWIYLINDIAYYKGNNIITKSFIERQKIMEDILNTDYDSNEENQMLYISKKNYFEYNNIKDLVENYMENLNYKCSGLYFKSVNNFSDNYLFIFPECRSDSKILNNGKTININEDSLASVASVASVASLALVQNTEEDDLFGDVEVIKTIEESIKEPIKETIKQTIKQNNNCVQKYSLEKTTCRFLINPTEMPDIYELYCKNNNNNNEKYSYASIPDIDTSNLVKQIIGKNYDFSDDINTRIENNNAIYVECNYHKGFKKWIPFKKVDSMDNINTINQIQIILDSL